MDTANQKFAKIALLLAAFASGSAYAQASGGGTGSGSTASPGSTSNNTSQSNNPPATYTSPANPNGAPLSGAPNNPASTSTTSGPNAVPSLSATPGSDVPPLAGPGTADQNPASGRSSRPSNSTSSTSDPSTSGPTGSPDTSTSGTTANVGKRWDAQVLTFVRTADTLEADSARLASTKAQSAQVKSFARTMVSEHSADRNEIQRLMKKLGVNGTSASEPSSIAELRSSASETKEKLQGLSGAEFDRAYMTAQVDMHRKVLNTIDQELIPRAEDAEVKSMLQKTRPKIEAHLRQAEKIQSTLK